MNPITKVMDGLKYSVKFGIIGIFVVGYASFMMYNVIQDHNKQIDFSALARSN
jgi:hypothetical protein